MWENNFKRDTKNLYSLYISHFLPRFYLSEGKCQQPAHFHDVCDAAAVQELRGAASTDLVKEICAAFERYTDLLKEDPH